MEPIRDPEIRSRVSVAFDLFEMAEGLMRQNLIRRYPEADEAEIEQRLLTWRRNGSVSTSALPKGIHAAAEPSG